MPSRFDKQKACVPCANAKRSCDKTLPGCQRCLDRDVDCHYPQPRRRRRDLLESTSPSAASIEAQSWVQPMIDDDAGLQLEPEAIGPLRPSLVEDHEWTLPTADEALPLGSTGVEFNDGMSGIWPDISTSSATEERPGIQASVDSSSLPWFLQPESWALHHTNHDPGCVRDIELEPSIEHIRLMLQTWLETGHNHFIHRKLYITGTQLPGYLQDAYLTLSAYTHCTSETRNIVTQIAEAKLAALVEETVTSEGPDSRQGASSTTADVLCHLSRVQALFTHLFIHLFDRSVRQRSKAEKHLHLLRRWVREIYAMAQRFRGASHNKTPDLASQINAITSSRSSDTLEDDRHFSTLLARQQDATQQPRVVWHLHPSTLAAEQTDDALQDLWRSWIIAESVRRTYTVVDTIINVYEIMTQGWADCQGGLLFTARKAAWDADSAVRWAQTVGLGDDGAAVGDEKEGRGQIPLFVPALRPEEVMAQCSARDVDDFAITCWAFIVGQEKINGWIDRSGERG